MSKIMTDEYILSKGYKEYNPTPLHCESIKKFFQKRFDDQIGEKYFIDIEQFDFSDLQNRYPDFTPVKYEYVVQLCDKQDRYMDIRFHADWHLDDVEEFVEKQWQLGLYQYYETWSDNNG